MLKRIQPMVQQKGGSLQTDILNQEKGRDSGYSRRSALGKEMSEIRRQACSRAGCCGWEWDAEWKVPMLLNVL